MKATALIGKIVSVLDRFRWNYVYDCFRKKYTLSQQFRFNGIGVTFYGDGDIIIGDLSYVGRYSSIQAEKGYAVRIGRKCAISHFVMIYTCSRVADHDHSFEPKIKCGDVCIGDYCWIGAHVFINPGINIGENTALGANSVVTHNLPPHAVCAGAPARVVRFKSYLSEEHRIELAKQYANVCTKPCE